MGSPPAPDAGPAPDAAPALAADTLTTWVAVVDMLGTLVTAAALIVGGYWAYLRFVKGREFRPHVEVDSTAAFVGPAPAKPGDATATRISVSLENIGTGEVRLVPRRGTVVRLYRPAAAQPGPPATLTRWRRIGTYRIFASHTWIEPGESVRDELLLQLPDPPDVVRVDTRVVLGWKPENIEVNATRIVDLSAPRADASSARGAPLAPEAPSRKGAT